MVWPCEENERGAHSEKNARCGNTREKKKRAAKPSIFNIDDPKRHLPYWACARVGACGSVGVYLQHCDL